MVVIEDKKALLIGDPNYFDIEAVSQYVDCYHWDVPAHSLDYVTVQRVLEYLEGRQRIFFMNELHRVLKPEGRATLYIPYWTSPNSVADPFLVWPPLTEMSIKYLADADFRERNKINYPQITADFHIYHGKSYAPKWHIRSDQTRDFAAEHYNSVVTELVYTLVPK